MPEQLTVVVFTPKLAIARGLVATLTSEGSRTYMFTSRRQCERFISNNDCDLLYICISDPGKELELSKAMQRASKNSKISILFHFTDDENRAQEETDIAPDIGAERIGATDTDKPAPVSETGQAGQAEAIEDHNGSAQKKKAEVIKSQVKEKVAADETAQNVQTGNVQGDEKKNTVDDESGKDVQTEEVQRKKTKPEGTRKDGERMKIVVAEDDVAIANIIKFKLKSLGFDVIHAIDGQEALDKTYEESPDLVILDVMMPKYTGTEVARMLRMDEKFSKIPILIITASSADQIEKLALKGGADRFLKKPFEMDKLVSTIHNLIDISKGTHGYN